VDVPVSKATARDAALLLAAGDPAHLMPLACYDAKARQFAPGDPCLDRVGEHAELRVESGGALTGDGFVPVSQCTTGVPPAGKDRGLEVSGQALGEGMLAVWPKDGPALDVAGGMTWSPTVEELTFLRSTLKKVAPELDGPLEVHQTFMRDLDGDGKPDRVYAVLLRGDAGKLPFLATIVIAYSTGGKTVALETTRADEDPKLSVLATIDLDGDGQRELVTRWFWRDHRYFHLDRVGDGPELLGTVKCGED
jgi:hypothetical protein